MKNDNKNLKRNLSTINEIEAASEEYVSEICELEKLNKRLRLAVINKKEMKFELTKMKWLYQEKEESLGCVEKKLESLKIKNKLKHIRNLNKKIKYRDECCAPICNNLLQFVIPAPICNKLCPDL